MTMRKTNGLRKRCFTVLLLLMILLQCLPVAALAENMPATGSGAEAPAAADAAPKAAESADDDSKVRIAADSSLNIGTAADNDSPESGSAENESSEAVTKELKVRFSGFVFPGEFEAQVPYSDSFFLKDARSYNHRLAQLSIGMSIAAFRWVGPDEPAGNTYIRDFFDEAGFTGISMSDYEKSPGQYTISSCIATREIATEEESFTLVAVALCGGNYTKEWASNVTMGNGNRHEGFAYAAELVENRVLGYLARRHMTDQNIKIWVSGFSRAGAIANLVGADLADMNLIPESNLFVYTFAAPQAAKDFDKAYPSIFNIVGKMDLIPRVAPREWGYGRYGTDLSTPSVETDSDFPERAERASKIFEHMTGYSWWNNPGGDLDLRLLYDQVVYTIPDTETYCAYAQDFLSSLVLDGNPIDALREIARIYFDPELSDPEIHGSVLSMAEYMIGLVAGDMFKKGEQTVFYQEGALTYGNYVHEHCPEIYLSWMLSSDDPDEIFSDNEDWMRINATAKGNYIVMDHDTEEVLCSWADPDEVLDVLRLEMPNAYISDQYDTAYDYYCVQYDEDSVVFILPCDGNYDLWFWSDADQTLLQSTAYFESYQSAGCRFLYAESELEGEVLALILNTEELTRELMGQDQVSNGVVVVINGENYTPDQSEELLQIESRIGLGKTVLNVILILAILAVVIVVLLIALIIHLIANHGRHRRKKSSG